MIRSCFVLGIVVCRSFVTKALDTFRRRSLRAYNGKGSIAEINSGEPPYVITQQMITDEPVGMFFTIVVCPCLALNRS